MMRFMVLACVRQGKDVSSVLYGESQSPSQSQSQMQAVVQLASEHGTIDD